MKKMIAVFAILISFGASVFATDEHQVSGTVNSIDKEHRTINITHGPIKSMGMMGMTMDFVVSDPAMLSEVKTGQKIDFVITTDKKGRFVIVDLQ